MRDATLIRLFLNDLKAKRPAVLIAHKKIVDSINLPKSIKVFEPSTKAKPFNVFENVPESRRALFADVMLNIVRGRSDVATTRIDKYVRAGVQTLLEVPSTFLDLKPLITDREYRDGVLTLVTDSALKDMWADFDAMTAKEKRDQTDSTISRLMSFTLEPRIRQCLGHKHNAVSFSGPLVVSLDDRELGDNAWLLGQLVLARLYMDSLEALQTTLYLPEAQHFPFLETLIERGTIPVIFSVQSLARLPKGFSVPQTVAFRTTVADAEVLEPEFQLKHSNIYTSLPLQSDYSAYFVDGVRTIPLRMFG